MRTLAASFTFLVLFPLVSAVCWFVIDIGGVLLAGPVQPGGSSTWYLLAMGAVSLGVGFCVAVKVAEGVLRGASRVSS